MKKRILFLLLVASFTITHAQVCFRNIITTTSATSLSYMASGDFNNDHIKDMAIVDQYLGGIHVLFGTNTQQMNEVNVIQNMMSNVFSIVAEDFNGDSLSDIAITAYTDTIYLFQSNGDGTFNRLKINVSSGANYICCADFNNDKIPDLLANGDSLTFLAGDGKGHFTKTSTSLNATPGKIKTALINGDNVWDLINFSIDGAAVLIGDGKGKFSSPTIIASTLVNTADFLCADFNGDGLGDVALLHNYSSSSIDIFQNTGTSFTLLQTLNASYAFNYMVAADFNKDNKMDLFTNDGLLYFGNGNGLNPNALMTPIGNGFMLFSDDLNKDTYPDIVVVGENVNNFSVLLCSTAITGLSISIIDPVCPGDYSTVTANVSGNGGPFKYLWDTNDSSSSIHRYGEMGGSLKVTAKDGCQVLNNYYTKQINPFIINAYTTMSGCGSQKNDLYLSVSGARPPYKYLWDNFENKNYLIGIKSGKYEVTISDSANCITNAAFDMPVAINYNLTNQLSVNAANPTKILQSDLNGDDNIDLICANLNSISIYINNGNWYFNEPVKYILGSNKVIDDMHMADINADGNWDIIVSSGNSIYAYFNNGNAIFSNAVVLKTLAKNRIIFDCGDFNGDKAADLVYFYYQSAVQVALNNGQGTFFDANSYSHYADNVCLGDFNGDNKLDICISEYGEIALAEGNGGGGFSNFIYKNNAEGQVFLKACDYNSDGKLDIIAGGNGRIYRLRGLGNSKFVNAKIITTNVDFNCINIGDLNADGYSFDMVFGYSGLTLMQMDSASKLYIKTILKLISNPSSISVADFNNDKKHDIAILRPDNYSIDIYSNCSVLGVKESIENNHMNIYPNPSTGVVNIEGEWSENTNIYVFNLNGQLMFQKHGNAKSIDLKSLPSGMYMIQARDQSKIYHAKVVLED